MIDLLEGRLFKIGRDEVILRGLTYYEVTKIRSADSGSLYLQYYDVGKAGIVDHLTLDDGVRQIEYDPEIHYDYLFEQDYDLVSKCCEIILKDLSLLSDDEREHVTDKIFFSNFIGESKKIEKTWNCEYCVSNGLYNERNCQRFSNDDIEWLNKGWRPKSIFENDWNRKIDLSNDTAQLVETEEEQGSNEEEELSDKDILELIKQGKKKRSIRGGSNKNKSESKSEKDNSKKNAKQREKTAAEINKRKLLAAEGNDKARKAAKGVVESEGYVLKHPNYYEWDKCPVFDPNYKKLMIGLDTVHKSINNDQPVVGDTLATEPNKLIELRALVESVRAEIRQIDYDKNSKQVEDGGYED